MSNPVIYYAARNDFYIPSMATALSFDYAQDLPFKLGDAQYDTFRARSLDGTVRASQVIDGRFALSLSFKLVSDAFRAQFLTFLRTVRGPLYPFWYQSTDGGFYWVRLPQDFNPSEAFRWGLHNIGALPMEGADSGLTIRHITAKTDPLGRVITDPLGRPELVWS
jgi:hypothetical protein